ncbi:MAG: hypothetical protein ACRC7O_08315 [Fimbriiglobus sp.]
MTRMSREFSLVLLGAGVLTAGYFAAPSRAEDLEKKADDQAAARVGHDTHSSTTHRTHGHVPLILFLHSPGYATGRPTGRPASMPGVSRGGFGSVGHSVGAGGGA